MLAFALALATACGSAAAQSASSGEMSQSPPDNADPWALSAIYTHSDLGSSRDNWQQLDVDAYFKPDPRWVLTAGADTRRRNDATDVVYSVGAEFYATPAWQFHASVSGTPDPDFTYERGYTVGTAWRAAPWLSLLLEARGFEFENGGDLQEWRPGFTLWFNDDATALTGRYTDGDAFDMAGYDAWSLRLDQRLDNGHQLSLSYANGIDPERDPAVPGVLLSEADYYSLFYRFPLRTGAGAGSGLDLILGAEYEERRNAYTRRGLSVGLVARF